MLPAVRCHESQAEIIRQAPVVKLRKLTIAQILQLIAISPVSLVSAFGLLAGVLVLLRSASGKGTSVAGNALAILLIVAAVSVLCLWVAILADDRAVAESAQKFKLVWFGLVAGCLVAGAILVIEPYTYRGMGSILFYGAPFGIGVWQLIRLAPAVWRPERSQERS